MLLTNRTGVKNTRDLLRAFGGLNETYGCTEAEYSGGMNFSARDFPALSTRLPRRRLQELAGLNGMYHLNGLLTVCGQDLFHTQIGVGNRLDGGRRRVKKYLWSFFRTAPAGQVRL